MLNMKIKIFAVLVSLSFLIADVQAATGSKVESKTESKNNDESYRKLEVFAKVLGYLEDHYIEKVDISRLMDDALKGITENLDPHTIYLSPDLYRQMKVDTSGEFGGVGVELGFNDAKELIIVTPTEDGPAIKQDMRTGDRLLEVNGKSTQGWTLFEAVKHIRGARGSMVTLTLLRKGDEKPFEVILKREIMHIQSVEYRMLPDMIGYIQIKSFQEKTDQEVKRAFNKLQGMTAKDKSSDKLKGLVLDLRNNPGGLLDQAINVADLFLTDGVIVSTRGRDNSLQSEAKAQGEGTLPYVPMITLINEGTASAAEIVAGALQDQHRSALLGSASFGKGSVQNIIDLEDGSALKITIARYYTPNGRPIQNVGNQPDIYVSSQTPLSIEPNMIREKDLQGRIETVDEKGTKPGSDQKTKEDKALAADIQLKSGMEYLKSANYFRIKDAKQ